MFPMSREITTLGRRDLNLRPPAPRARSREVASPKRLAGLLLVLLLNPWKVEMMKTNQMDGHPD
jgi:hypothetical protein